MDTLWPVENTDSQACSSFYNSLSVAYLSEIATALGRNAEAEQYAEQFDSMTSAFYATCTSCKVWASCCGPELENHSECSGLVPSVPTVFVCVCLLDERHYLLLL